MIRILVLSCAVSLFLPVGYSRAIAGSELSLLAMPETATLDGMRALSKYDDGHYEDQSAQGMLVGTGTGERRIVLAKPAFTGIVSMYVDWTVVDVRPLSGGASVVLSRPLRYWGASTPASEAYNIPTTGLSSDYLVSSFQRLLASGGDYSVTTGVALSGTGPLTDSQPVNLRFLVTIRDPSPFLVEGLSLTSGASGIVIFRWRSSRRGYADIYVNGVRRIVEQFTVADRVNSNTIYDDWLAAGENTVHVVVREPEDLSSTAQSTDLTINR